MITKNISELKESEQRKHFLESSFIKNSLEVEIIYKSIFENTKILRDFIVDISNFFSFDIAWKSRLTLIADELNNNAIEYGSLENDINKMVIIIKIDWDNLYLTLEVYDSWKWNKTKTAEQMEALREYKENKWFEKYNSIRWRWLFMIISKLVDNLFFKDSNPVWLVVGVKKTFKKDSEWKFSG